MSWLALRGSDGTARKLGAAPLARTMPRGSLVLELDLAQFAQTSTPVLRLGPRHEPASIFAIERMLDGRLHLLRRAGAQVSHLSVGLGREPISGWLRLTYHWDTSCHRSLLTAENLTEGTIRQQEIPGALPLTYDDAQTLFTSECDCLRHPALGWIGLADHWHPVGPMPGLCGSTRISTPDGPRELRTLKRGDVVLTADNGPQPVLWQGAVPVPSVGAFRPVRLIAPYFACDTDLVLQPSQRVVLSGAEVEYLFNEDEVLVEARHLVNGHAAIWEPEAAIVACHGLLLQDHDLICADGCWVDSLYLGRISRNRDLALTTAPGAVLTAGAMPLHTAAIRRELLAFEAQTLALARAHSRAPFAA